MAFRKLYPAIRPYSTGFLAVDDIHTLYWEQSGNPDGVPVLFLHGGPGAGTTPEYRRFFDPHFYRIVLFDQRGSGRSEPLGEVRDNSPAHLVADIEALRQHLRIGKWHVFGGSWGSTLAMLYAADHPDACASLILRGIWLMTGDENKWWLEGIRTVFPEVWERFARFIPETERGDLLSAYHARLFGDDEAAKTAAAMQWVGYESACATLYPHYQTIYTDDQRKRAVAMARLEAHYFKNHVRTDADSILKRVDAFRHIPAVIIHGRYDMITPLKIAHDLHTVWPEADYVVVPDGGHSAMDPAIRDRLIAATDNARSIR
ncbi:MAG: prolyl aminopeptidase [Alphaproteobacteria bacterium]|nr:prolyl aminopeptidase [Alphaproteobacteria bacterium]USO07471.1 MAG: prolyl aminopeptidase [Rhodospirillales bacterium]